MFLFGSFQNSFEPSVPTVGEVSPAAATANAGIEKQEAIKVCSKVFLYISFLQVNI